MTKQFTAIVNAVGPTSGDYLGYLIQDEMDDTSQHPNGLVRLSLTARDNTFSDFPFFVVDSPLGVANQVLPNQMLATALAAINTGNQVMADVDWPPPKNPDGSDSDAYCHSLWLNSD